MQVRAFERYISLRKSYAMYTKHSFLLNFNMLDVHSVKNWFLKMPVLYISGARGLEFGLGHHQHPYFVCTKGEGSGKSAHFCTDSPKPSLLDSELFYDHSVVIPLLSTGSTQKDPSRHD